MAKDRRPQMDYYEYKRRHEALNPSDTPEAQPFARDESPEGEEVKKKGLLGGAKRAPRESVAEAPAPRQQETQTPPAAAKARPADVAQALREEPEDAEELDDLEELDEPQIDTPFSDAFHKMKSLGGKLAGLGGKLKRRPRDEDEDEDETQAQPAVTVGLVEDATSEGKAQSAKPAKPAAPKKAPAAKQDEEDEAPKRKLRLPFLSRDKADEAEEGEAATKPARKRFSLFSAPMASEDEDDEDDDIAPSGGGIKLFGRRRARDEDEYDDEYDEDDEDDEDAQDAQTGDASVGYGLTQQLAQAIDEGTPSRRA
ncbi:MAG: hypothetical protein RR150_09940, partial [Clostridia bacterium]